MDSQEPDNKKGEKLSTKEVIELVIKAIVAISALISAIASIFK